MFWRAPLLHQRQKCQVKLAYTVAVFIMPPLVLPKLFFLSPSACVRSANSNFRSSILLSSRPKGCLQQWWGWFLVLVNWITLSWVISLSNVYLSSIESTAVLGGLMRALVFQRKIFQTSSSSWLSKSPTKGGKSIYHRSFIDWRRRHESRHVAFLSFDDKLKITPL